MGYIYKITNSINGKLYIGQTRKTIEERFQVHIKNAQKHINRYLYDAMNKYGKKMAYISVPFGVKVNFKAKNKKEVLTSGFHIVKLD